MNNTTRNLLLASTLVAMGSIASAQVLGGAANAAANVRAHVPPPPPPPPPPAVSVSAAAQHAAAASAVARGTATPPASIPPVAVPAAANVSAAGATGGQAAVSAARGVNASAGLNASAAGQANGLAVAAIASRQATVAISPADMVAAIHAAKFESRNTLATTIEARLETTKSVVAELKSDANAAGGQARAEFAKAAREVRARERELRASLKAAVKAEGESTWGEVQSALARDYRAYADAVVSASAAAGASAGTSEPKS